MREKNILFHETQECAIAFTSDVLCVCESEEKIYRLLTAFSILTRKNEGSTKMINCL